MVIISKSFYIVLKATVLNELLRRENTLSEAAENGCTSNVNFFKLLQTNVVELLFHHSKMSNFT